MLCATFASAETAIPLKTPFEKSSGKRSASLQEVTEYYHSLCKVTDKIRIEEIGRADGNYPLQVIYFSADGDTDPAHWKKEGKTIILVNNAIHAGEPDGVDASMMLIRDAVVGNIKVPGNVVLAVIPVFNIGGFMNRGSYSRANQNGPEEYGFRGNGQNLDLNRDFMKTDARETRALEALFARLDPDIFIDNHVSDGADYQHVMTLLATQHDKLGGKTGDFLYHTFTPAIYADMKKQGYDLVPYVNDFSNTPDNGWREFYESPRFASGYAALFNTLAYVPETHMLKPFAARVMATYQLMKCFIKEAGAYNKDIHIVRTADRATLQVQRTFTLDWKIDTTRYDMITFKGYKAGHKPSLVSGLPRLYYDHDQPFTKKVPFYNHFVPAKSCTAPKAYIIPRGWTDVIDHLKNSGVEMTAFAQDTNITVTAYHIDNYETGQKPYEKHYQHKNIQATPQEAVITFKKGDYFISTNQPAKRYLVEILEPTAPDGLFAWNFFDAILQQKEYFSDYVFEDMAAEMLKKDKNLYRQLEEKKQQDPDFAKNAGAQVDFVYRHSPYMEPGYMRYPVYRIEK